MTNSQTHALRAQQNPTLFELWEGVLTRLAKLVQTTEQGTFSVEAFSEVEEHLDCVPHVAWPDRNNGPTRQMTNNRVPPCAGSANRKPQIWGTLCFSGAGDERSIFPHDAIERVSSPPRGTETLVRLAIADGTSPGFSVLYSPLGCKRRASRAPSTRLRDVNRRG